MNEKSPESSDDLQVAEYSIKLPDIENVATSLGLLWSNSATVSLNSLQDEISKLREYSNQVTSYLNDDFYQNFQEIVESARLDFGFEEWTAFTAPLEVLQDQTSELKNDTEVILEGLRGEFQSHFYDLVSSADFEFGFRSVADEYLHTAIQEYGTYVREWINDLFLQKFGDPSFITGLLRVIAHFDYEEMYPQGVTMATAALSHKDAEVRDCAVRCFESWSDPESLKILKNVSFRESWLCNYLEEVISDLEAMEGNDSVR